MPHNLRGEPYDEVGETAGDAISSVGCGLVSIILTAVASQAATVKLYDTTDTSTLGTCKKALSAGGTSGIAATEVYCPCKPDAFSSGLVAVVTGSSAKAYISIEP